MQDSDNSKRIIYYLTYDKNNINNLLIKQIIIELIM